MITFSGLGNRPFLATIVSSRLYQIETCERLLHCPIKIVRLRLGSFLIICWVFLRFLDFYRGVLSEKEVTLFQRDSWHLHFVKLIQSNQTASLASPCQDELFKTESWLNFIVIWLNLQLQDQTHVCTWSSAPSKSQSLDSGKVKHTLSKELPTPLLSLQ